MDIVESSRENDAVVLSVKGRMDATAAPEFDKHLARLMDGGDTIFILDLEGLEYISSAGVRSILVLAKNLKNKDGKFFLAAATPPVMKVFKMSGFEAIIPIRESVASAMAQL